MLQPDYARARYCPPFGLSRRSPFPEAGLRDHALRARGRAQRLVEVHVRLSCFFFEIVWAASFPRARLSRSDAPGPSVLPSRRRCTATSVQAARDSLPCSVAARRKRALQLSKEPAEIIRYQPAYKQAKLYACVGPQRTALRALCRFLKLYMCGDQAHMSHVMRPLHF